MNKRREMLAVLACSAALLSSACSSSLGSNVGGRKESPAVAMRKSLDTFFEASKKRDWDAAASVMTEDFEFFTDGAQAFGKPEYVRLLKSDDLVLGKYELRDVRVGVSAAEDLGWMSYKGYFEQSIQGKASRVETAETLLFRNDGGKWRMFRAQASVHELKEK